MKFKHPSLRCPSVENIYAQRWCEILSMCCCIKCERQENTEHKQNATTESEWTKF